MSRSRLATETIDDEAGLASVRIGWDALAVERRRPCCAPDWMLAWWRHARPHGSALRVVAVSEGGRLIGLAPLWARRGGLPFAFHEVLAGSFSPPVGPLAAPGREREVGEAVAAALADVRPRPSALRLWSEVGEDPEDPAGGVAAAWPGGEPRVEEGAAVPVPVVDLEGRDYEQWFEDRSSHFRREARRCRRRLVEADARFDLAEGETIEPALDAFVELHAARWRPRGGSGILVGGLRRMLSDAAAAMVPSGRMRIFTIEHEGRPIAVNVFLAAGGELSAWNCGFDREWTRYSPSMQLDMHALADAFERGESRLNLGPGDAGYKPRLATGREEVAALTVIPRGASFLLTRLRLAAGRARRGLDTRVPEQAKRPLRGVLRR